MVHEANVKQAAAEKQLKEAQGQVSDDEQFDHQLGHVSTGSPRFGMFTRVYAVSCSNPLTESLA